MSENQPNAGDRPMSMKEKLLAQRRAAEAGEAPAKQTPAPAPAPTLHIKRRPDSIFDYQFEDFEVREYQCHPAIKAPVAV